jgi:glutathione S-transferase
VDHPGTVPVMVADLHAGLCGSLAIVQHFDADVPRKLILLNELIQRVHVLFFLLTEQVPLL